MKLFKSIKLKIRDIFNEYSDDSFVFNKTKISIKLLDEYGSELFSRSLAKRVTARLDSFKEVLLDFEGVEFIGQGFADQIFRVFANENKDTEITAKNTNDNIDSMIKHVLR
jgi:hypothetical protein